MNTSYSPSKKFFSPSEADGEVKRYLSPSSIKRLDSQNS